MWPLTRRYLVVAFGLACAELALVLILRRSSAPPAVSGALLFAAWTVLPLAFLGRTALWAYDLVARARRARRDAAQPHAT